MAVGDAADPLLAQLDAGMEALGLMPSPDVAESMLNFVRELLHWNRRINLTAIVEPREVLIQHVLDSLAIAPFITGPSLLDVGSGGGFPGLPLALLRPDLEVSSVDSRNKKIAFQRHAARQLGLSNFTATAARIEAWVPPHRYPQITSRAFASLSQFAALAGRHLADGGQLLAMKGKHPADELAEMPSEWELVKMHRLNVPGLAAERHLLIFTRAARG